MTLLNILDYLESRVDCKNGYAGRIDRNDEYCIGVFSSRPLASDIPVGGIANASYRTKAARVLIHWGKKASDAEKKAAEIFSCLLDKPPVIGGFPVQYIDLRTAEPESIDSDNNGIFEFVIDFVIYYRKD